MKPPNWPFDLITLWQGINNKQIFFAQAFPIALGEDFNLFAISR